MLVLTEADIEAVLDRDGLIDAVAAGLAQLSSGGASLPPRSAAMAAECAAMLAVMPGYLPGGAGGATLGAKLVSLFPGNAGGQWPTHQAVIVLFDPDAGVPQALLAGTALTAERTAAASAVATRCLANPDATVLTIVGTGVQARAHARSVTRVCRAPSEIRVTGRDPAKAAALAGELGPLLTVPIRAVTSIPDALAEAGVVCVTTHAPDPVIRREWLPAGVHVNSVGFHPEGREIDAATVVAALVVVESRTSALAPVPAGSNDLLWPIRDGLIGPDHVHAELGELVLGARPGRSSPDQITLYKSVGVAVEDLAAASLVVTAAEKRGVGQHVNLTVGRRS